MKERVKNQQEKMKFDGYTVIRRGNSYQYYMSKDLTGEIVRQSLKTYDEKTALKRARELYLGYLADYTPNGLDKKSFKKNAEDFIAMTNNPQHKEYMNRLFIPYFSETIGNRRKIRDISELTNLDLIKYVEYRREKKSTRTHQYAKPATIIRENNTLRAFLNWCYTTGRIKKQLTLPTIKSKESRYDDDGNPIFEDLSGKRDAFTSDEVKLIFSTLQQEIKNEVNQHNRRRKELLYNYISILYETGIRPVELRALTWKNYVADYGEGGLFVNVYSRKQNNKRNIALSPNLVKLLNNLYQQQKEFCRQHNLPFNEEDINIISLCNGNETKNHYEIKAVKEFDNGFRRLLDRCGIKHINNKVLYSFRHYYITSLVQNETPTLTIAKQCGTSAKMIEQYYDQSSHLADMKQLFIKPIQVAV